MPLKRKQKRKGSRREAITSRVEMLEQKFV